MDNAMLLLSTSARFSLRDQHGQSVEGRGWIWLCLFIDSEPPSRSFTEEERLGAQHEIEATSVSFLHISPSHNQETSKKQNQSITTRSRINTTSSRFNSQQDWAGPPGHHHGPQRQSRPWRGASHCCSLCRSPPPPPPPPREVFTIRTRRILFLSC